MTSENANLNEEVRVAQDNLRLSANNMTKMKNEIKILSSENEELKKQLNSRNLGSNKRIEEL